MSPRTAPLAPRALVQPLALAGMLALGTACGETAPPQPGRGVPVVRVPLSPPAEETEPPVLAVVTGRYEVDPELAETHGDLAALDYDGAEPVRRRIRTVQIPETETVELVGIQEVRVHLPGPFDPSTVDLIEVNLSGVDPAHVFLRGIVRHGGEAIVSDATEARVTRHITREVIDFSELERLEGAIDEVVVQLSILPEEVEELPTLRLFSIRLRDRPRRQWMPALGEQELVLIGNERRSAYRLSQKQPLSGGFRVDGQRELTFSYGIPEVLRMPSSDAEVRVHLEGGGASAEHTFPTKTLFDRGEHWRTGRVSLEGFEGVDLRVRFELVGEATKSLYCAVGGVEAWAPVPEPPTVLLVTSDTHRSDYVGAAKDGANVRTPTIDALAAEGVFFEDAYSSINITNPSHIALMTGVHPRDTRIVSNELRLSEGATTLAELFREQGYATYASVSVRHLDATWSGLGQGFDRVAGPEDIERPANETIGDLMGWLKDADGRPLFVWLHVFDAHHPYEPVEPFAGMYYPRGRDPTDRSLPSADLELDVAGFPNHVDPDYFEAMYRGEISFLDAELGKLLAVQRFRTAIVGLTADHGENLHGGVQPFGHRGLSNNTLSVPLILRYPGAPAGTRIDVPVQQMDLGRTLLDLAGLEAVEFPGHDLLESPPGGPRFAMEDNYVGASVQFEGWMLVLPLKVAPVYGLDEEDYHRAFLYDHRSDPGHDHDLSAEEPDLTRRLRQALVEWLSSARTEGLEDVSVGTDPGKLRDLERLGYAAAEPPSSSVWIDPDCDCPNCASYQ